MNIEVVRSELARVRVVDGESVALGDGQVRVCVDAFGLTSNNITYAVFGEMLRYWEFFPAGGEDAEAWGRIPVWGFGEVVETRSPNLAMGERLYGCYPMASELVIDVGRADSRGVSDIATHRAEMAGAYSRYVRCSTDPVYRADREAHQMLLYPLFFTSFVIDDFLLDNDDFGAEQIIVSSASSKTAIGVAHQARQRGAHIVGLTSAANRHFVHELDMYDQVLTYDEAPTLASRPAVYIDIAGNRDVLLAVHRRLDGELAYSMTVGGTHWDHETDAAAAELPGPAPEFFFAPTQMAKRSKEWGRDELDRRSGAAWDRFAGWADGWIELQAAQGSDEVIDVYHELLGGHADPRAGFVCSLLDEARPPDD